jgi:nicotinate-nucleotide adenylyltransferase
MKFAVLGGSFDPIHNGHIKLAQAAVEQGYDRVIFVPAFQSPFKTKDQRGSAEARLAMVLASIAGDRRFTADACEIERGLAVPERPSYTIDTLRDIVERYVSGERPGLLLGDDLACDFPSWRDADGISAIATLLVGRRERSEAALPYSHVALKNAVVELSSARVRTTIAAKEAWQELVPEGARRIIEQNGLYGATTTTTTQNDTADDPRSIRHIENRVRLLVPLHRFLHSRNVALHSSDLAERFGLDVDQAYLAGITHDAAKAQSDADIIALAREDGLPFSDAELANPGALLHGRAAAVMLQRDFDIHDADVLNAVRYHTTGRKQEMSPLEKVVYMCDKIESGRHSVARNLREAAFGPTPLDNLDALYDFIRNATNKYLIEHGVKPLWS